VKIPELDEKLFPIVCTQPRKVSTMKIAKRVSEETKLVYEEEVYPLYNILKLNNFENIKKKSKFIFINETLLLFLLIKDPLLTNIHILILDEAHERTVNLDIILFLLRNYTLRKRKDLKLIITSATIEPTQIMNYLSHYKPCVINCVTPNKQISYVYYNQPSICKNQLI
jgi:HrpA-like RNA helicase